nr:hypothetical protein Iba_chr02aCG3430 [Ipomoea batatas]GMC62334.1 hypothetical protein Iba_chr02cCG2910 [Ipomoea batatas]
MNYEVVIAPINTDSDNGGKEKPLFNECRRFVRRLEIVRFQHVLCEGNKWTDLLINMGYDSKWNCTHSSNEACCQRLSLTPCESDGRRRSEAPRPTTKLAAQSAASRPPLRIWVRLLH